MPYLRETLASIKAQTYTDFEVLVWLVGDSDGSKEELDRWIPGQLPGRVFESELLDVGATLAQLVSASNAEFCARIDSDDTCAPERLARQIAFLDEHPDIALVGSAMRIVDSAGRPTGRFHDYPQHHLDIVCGMLVNNTIGHPSVLFRRAAVLAAGNYADSGVEDYDLWLRLACTHRLATLPEYLVNYRVHRESRTQRDPQDIISPAAMKILTRYSTTLVGLSPEIVAGLHARERKFVLRPAVQVARHLSRREGTGWWAILRRPKLIDVFRFFRRPYDLVSLLILALIDRRRGALRSCFGFVASLIGSGLKRRISWRHVPGSTPR